MLQHQHFLCEAFAFTYMYLLAVASLVMSPCSCWTPGRGAMAYHQIVQHWHNSFQLENINTLGDYFYSGQYMVATASSFTSIGTCKSTATILTASLSSSGLSLLNFLDRTWFQSFISRWNFIWKPWNYTYVKLFQPGSNFQEQHRDRQPSEPRGKCQTHRWSAEV